MSGFQIPTGPAQIQVYNTADAALNGVKCLVYGGAGRGKTRLCATAPNPIILSAESGVLSLRNFQLPYIIINSLAQLEAAYWYCVQGDGRQFWTICIDSISEIAEACLAAELKNHKDPRKAYGEMANQIMAWLRAFRDIPQRHVYFTAKQARMTDQSTGGMIWGPLMPGQQLDQQLPYFVDEVFQINRFVGQDGVPYWALRTQPDNQHEAKDRSGALDPWEPADLAHVFNKIMAT